MGSRVVRPEVSLADVKQQIRGITESPAFSHAPRQAKLLEYLCNKVLLGESDQIKATTIAMEVFGRPWDFDETKDAVVRVEAHRLRRKLAKYYEEYGAQDEIRIILTPGGYVPEFVSTRDIPADGSALPNVPVADAVKTQIPLTEPVPATPDRPAASPDFRRRIAIFGAVFLGVALAVAAFLIVRDRTQQKTAAVVRPSQSTGFPAVPPGREVRILAGHTNGTYTDRFGRTWGEDRYFNGGVVEPGPKEFYGRPPDAGLFATMRTGEFSYDIPVAPGTYELHLYWAEPIFRAENESNGGGENERRFHVELNGAPILRAFDVVADSGISAVDVRSFKGVQPANDGKVHIRFAAAYGTPFVNGVELIPAPSGRALPVRIRAHELAFSDHFGNSWSPDNFYVGGRLATHKGSVIGTQDPGLYAGERYGNFNYAIPVPSGKYAITLYFAETWFRPDSNGQDKGGQGTRIFDVYCNGTTLLKDFDMLAATTPFQPVVRTFHGVRPSGQGKLLITFSPILNYAAVKAIEVIEEQ